MVCEKVCGRLTDREERFVQALADGCSAVEAYRRVYPKSRALEDVVVRRAERMLKKPAVFRRYEELRCGQVQVLGPLQIAQPQEVLSYLTAVMRGEKKDLKVVSCKTRIQDVDEEGNRVLREVLEPTVMEVPVRLTDTIRAAELLGKRYGLFTERVQVGPDERLRVVDDIVGGEDG